MMGIDARAARATWTVILVLLFCLMIYAIRQTILIFIVSLLFAYLLLPIVDFFDRALPMVRSRTPALALVYAFMILLLIAAGTEIGTRAAQQANTLAQSISDFVKPEEARQLPLPQQVRPLGARLLSLIRSGVQMHYQEILSSLPATGIKAVGAAANFIFVIIVPILSFFFLKDGRALQRLVVASVEDVTWRGTLREIATDLNVLLAQYMRALVLLGSAVLVTYATFFVLMGVPYGILLAAIAFPLEFIPMLGPLLSSAIILVVAGFAGYHHLIWIAVFLAVYRIFQDYVLSPHLMSSGMELHPLLVIFGVFAGEQMAGVAGAFLSVPVMAALRILYKRLERTRIKKETAPNMVPVEAK